MGLSTRQEEGDSLVAPWIMHPPAMAAGPATVQEIRELMVQARRSIAVSWGELGETFHRCLGNVLKNAMRDSVADFARGGR